MLVLSRKIGEEIRIGGSVNLSVLAISGGRVKLGISGPRAVRVLRAELPERDPAPGPPPLADTSWIEEIAARK